MKRHLGEGHETLLAELLAGAEAPRAAMARSPLAGCPACEDLLAVGERLDGLGAVEQAALADALGGAAPPRGSAEERVRATILASLGSAQRSPAGKRRWPPLLAAAAVLVALFGLWRWVGRGPGEPGPQLGPALELLHPVGEVVDFAPFRWAPAGPEAGWYRVVVQPLDGDATRPPTDSGRILGTSWEPSLEVRRSWGDRIRWTLEVYRATGGSDLVDARSASAELSSR